MNRKQCVEVNGKQSHTCEIKVGVPQGSKLAATLFLIYINDIFNLNLTGIEQFYADDGMFKYVGDSIEEIIENIKADLKKNSTMV